jgi:membrane protein insertase, YidC/Oxa1 family, C-terminal domain
MQAIQPDIERLKKKYGHDPQKLNMEQRKLMKEKGVSTFGGCLPMLIMMPLLFMFFAAFRAWSNQQALALILKSDFNPAVNQLTLNAEAMDSFARSRFLWITNIWRPDNLARGGTMMNAESFWATFAASSDVKDFIFYSNNTDALNKVLYELHFFTKTFAEDGTVQYVLAQDGGAAFKAAYETFIQPITANKELIGGAFENMSNGYAILPILAGATTFLSSWIMQRSQKKTAAAVRGSRR